MYLYVRDTMVVVEEGNPPHPHCLQCDMLVLWASLNGRNLNISQCAKGEDRNHCGMNMDNDYQGVMANIRNLRNNWCRCLGSLGGRG